ncbi:MAG: cell surface receptor domain protein [Bacteroidetes bacterium]|nr:cell surface receptor domain protein [Bacteroidota bacterium]
MKKLYPAFAVACSLAFTSVRAQPAITSFSPASGPAGTSVTIHGSNFNPAASGNVVFFGATQAAVTAASADSLVVTVPVAASYQYISVADTNSNMISYSLRPFLSTFSCGLPVNTSSFSISIDSTADPVAGMAGSDITTGDLDGDGKADLVLINFDDNSISILQNTSTPGSISYAAKIDFRTGTHPMNIVTGDFNADGKPDLAVSNSSDNTVSIFKNTSSGGMISFEPNRDFYIGFSPYYLSVADLNADGKAEIATIDVCNSTITILKNAGIGDSIHFTAPLTFSLGFYPQHLSIGDLNGDSKPDLAVTGSAPFGTYTLFTCKNTSTGGTLNFEPGVGYSVGSSTRNAAIGDLNGDGKMDLAVAVQGSNVVAVLKNTSTSGAITFDMPSNYPGGYLCISVAIDDMNGDGKADLVSIGYPNIISVIRNASTPSVVSFYPKVSFYGANDLNGLSIADLDGDGKPDISTVSGSSNTLTILRNKLCEATGLSEATLSGDVRIYPNPFDSKTTLYFGKAIKNGTVKISDITGKTVRTASFSGDQLTVQKEEMQAGVYFIEVSSGNEVISNQKIVLQ